MKLFINFLLSTAVTFFTVLFLPGLQVGGYVYAFYIAVAIGIINICVKPLLEISSVVPTFITIMLALFFLDGAVIVLADWIFEGFSAEKIGYVILFSAVISVLNWGIYSLVRGKIEQ